MPYDERTLCELSESAEITPIGIQLEVNAEIFNTLHNLLCTMREDKDISLLMKHASTNFGGRPSMKCH